MSSNFPTSLDDFTNPSSSDELDSPSHSGQHADLNDAVEALEAKVGIDSSADTDSIDYILANNVLKKAAGGASVENIGAVEFNVNTVATTGSTETLDTSTYDVHDCTMDQACTFTFSNPAPSGKATTFVLVLRGAFTPTFPAAVKWADGAAPSYSTPTIYTFTTVDAGTTWWGTSAGKAFS